MYAFDIKANNGKTLYFPAKFKEPLPETTGYHPPIRTWNNCVNRYYY